MRNSNLRAFSLIELSIVILIIGILIAGVTQSSRLVTQMRLSSARTLTNSAPVSSIKGLLVWLEPTSVDSFLDAEAGDALDLTVWKDINPQSSSKITATVTAAAAGDITYAANGINGLPTVNFKIGGNATKRLALSASLDSNSNATTAFVVYRDLSANSGSTNRTLFWNGATTAQGWGYMKVNTTWLRRVASIADNDGAAMSLTAPEIVSITMSGATTSDKVNSYVNGVIDINNVTLASAFTTPTAFFVGNYSTAGAFANPWQGYISEVIVYDRVLKSEERKSIETYLGKKYGIKVTN